MNQGSLCSDCEIRLLEAFVFRGMVWKSYAAITIPSIDDKIEFFEDEQRIELEVVVEDSVNDGCQLSDYNDTFLSDLNSDEEEEGEDMSENFIDETLDSNIFVVDGEIIQMEEELVDNKMIKIEPDVDVDSDAITTTIVNDLGDQSNDEDDDIEYLIDEIIDDNSDSMNSPSTKRLASKSGKHFCQVCSEACSSQSNLYRHMKRKHVPDFRNMNRIGSRKLTCELCNVEMSSISNLNRHMKRVHLKIREENKAATCRLCHITFCTQTEYIQHRRKFHDNRKLKHYICDVCGKVVRSTQCLKEHVRAIHTDERPYSCDECDYRSAHKMALVVKSMIETMIFFSAHSNLFAIYSL